MSVIQNIKQNNFGFFTSDQIPSIVEEDRLHPCLVRCGGGRFSCPAQDVAHFVAIIGRDGTDYVRDASLL